MAKKKKTFVTTFGWGHRHPITGENLYLYCIVNKEISGEIAFRKSIMRFRSYFYDTYPTSEVRYINRWKDKLEYKKKILRIIKRIKSERLQKANNGSRLWY